MAQKAFGTHRQSTLPTHRGAGQRIPEQLVRDTFSPVRKYHSELPTIVGLHKIQEGFISIVSLEFFIGNLDDLQ